MKKRSKKPVRSHHVADLKKLRLFVRKQSTAAKAAALVAALGVVILVVAVSSDMQPRKVGGQSAALKTSTTSTTSVPAESAPTLPVVPPIVEASPAQEPARQTAAVTITGCLERDAATFRLKDTAGEEAPKARSWKSAFLKKGSASVEVVDAAHRMKLPSHVGQRVRVTGTLVKREMQVRSITRIAPSCAVKS